MADQDPEPAEMTKAEIVSSMAAMRHATETMGNIKTVFTDLLCVAITWNRKNDQTEADEEAEQKLISDETTNLWYEYLTCSLVGRLVGTTFSTRDPKYSELLKSYMTGQDLEFVEEAIRVSALFEILRLPAPSILGDLDLSSDSDQLAARHEAAFQLLDQQLQAMPDEQKQRLKIFTYVNKLVRGQTFALNECLLTDEELKAYETQPPKPDPS